MRISDWSSDVCSSDLYSGWENSHSDEAHDHYFAADADDQQSPGIDLSGEIALDLLGDLVGDDEKHGEEDEQDSESQEVSQALGDLHHGVISLRHLSRTGAGERAASARLSRSPAQSRAPKACFPGPSDRQSLA